MIKFFVAGEPRAKQSFIVTGRGRGMTPIRVRIWQSEVGWEAMKEMRSCDYTSEDRLTGELAVRLIFQLGNARVVDLDNLSKAVLDGLNGICWEDDRQIVDLHLIKDYVPDNPGVWVEIEDADQGAFMDRSSESQERTTT